MRQTIRRYGVSAYGVNQDGHDAMSISYHGTDHHGVCHNCGADMTFGWLVRGPVCVCGLHHTDEERVYCLDCVTVVSPHTPNLA